MIIESCLASLVTLARVKESQGNIMVSVPVERERCLLSMSVSMTCAGSVSILVKLL